MSMKLIVGLGNPGRKYAGTRHNVGFMVVDKLAGDVAWKESKGSGAEVFWMEFEGEKVELMKPQKFMNESGGAVARAKKKHPNLEISDIYIVHDDLDIPLGKFKIQKGRGPKVHNGLQSIYERVGKDFWHVRVGIDNRSTINDQRSNGHKYVLQKFNDEEKKIIDEVIAELVVRLREV